MRKIALVVGGLVVLLALAGASYEAIEARVDARRFPETGRLVDVGGYRLKLNCIGVGSPTVILEAGLGDLSFEWRAVQPEIAKVSRVCSYDRAGYGGSDPGPMPRTSGQIAKELHTLLRNANEAPPYVLVGHSFGGYSVRVFNGRYPNDVAGIVLADATQEDQYELLPKAWKAISVAQLKHYQRQARYALPFVGLGIARLMLRTRGMDQGSYLILQVKYLRARASELENIQVSAEQARTADHISEKPLVVLTAAESFDAVRSNGLSKPDFEGFQRIWEDDLQMRLARLSTHGRRIVVQGSGHDIPSDRPNSIVNAVNEVRVAAMSPHSPFMNARN
jgi:Predicted hydrolases or acyltransferases (alpha/beta hydrolase superfamily)